MMFFNGDLTSKEFYNNPSLKRTTEEVFINECFDSEVPLPEYIVPENSFDQLPDWIEAVFAVLNIIILIFSFCGNIGALLVLYQSRTSKRSTKVYLISLAICDLTLTLTSPTVDLSQLISRYRGWILGEFLCRVIPFIQTFAVMGVALFLVAIAAERYLCVVRAFEEPLNVRKWKEFFPTIAVILIWIGSIGIAIPNLWYYRRASFWTFISSSNGSLIRPRNETCKTYYLCLRTGFDSQNVAYYSVLGLAALIPTICFIFCYISIIIFVKRHASVIQDEATTNGGVNRAKRSRRTLRLIMGLILLNLICRIPVWSFVIVTGIKQPDSSTAFLLMFYGFHLLSNISSLLNPFFYAIFNDSIRSTKILNPNGGLVIGNENSNSDSEGCCHLIRSCCYKHIKSTSLDYFSDKSRNNYDFTKQSKFATSVVSTQKFNISERNEFAITSPITSSDN